MGGSGTGYPSEQSVTDGNPAGAGVRVGLEIECWSAQQLSVIETTDMFITVMYFHIGNRRQ